MNDDPFSAAFGEDDDEVDDIAGSDQPRPSLRDCNNGVLSFHNGTEYALLAFVRQEIQKQSATEALETSSHDITVNRRLIQLILKSIDQFCTERHWMMHVGPQKGYIVQDFLKDRIQRHCRQYEHEQIFHVLELGTYCGYSTIRWIETLLQFTTNFHIFTVDINAHTQTVARQLITLAGLQKYVTFILRQQSSTDGSKDPDCFGALLRKAMTYKRNHSEESNCKEKNFLGDVPPAPMIHFLFVDHAKELYLSDLQLLASNHFIQRNSAVAADNVVFFQLTEYRDFVASLQAKGIVQTDLVTDGIFLEYSDVHADTPDGLELTVFLKDLELQEENELPTIGALTTSP